MFCLFILGMPPSLAAVGNIRSVEEVSTSDVPDDGQRPQRLCCNHGEFPWGLKGLTFIDRRKERRRIDKPNARKAHHYVTARMFVKKGFEPLLYVFDTLLCIKQLDIGVSHNVA